MIGLKESITLLCSDKSYYLHTNLKFVGRLTVQISMKLMMISMSKMLPTANTNENFQIFNWLQKNIQN